MSQLREQLRRRILEECGRIASEINQINYYVRPGICVADTFHLYRKYVELLYGADEQSMARVLEACNTKLTLVDFAPELRRLQGLEGLKNMTLEEFLRTWKRIMDTLKRQYRQKYVTDDVYKYIDSSNRLKNVLMEEVAKVALKLGEREWEIERILKNECP